MGYIIKSEKEEDSRYTSDYWDCVERMKKEGYPEDLARGWCEYIYG